MLLSPRCDPAVTTTIRAPLLSPSTPSPLPFRMTLRPATSSRACWLPRAPSAALRSWRAGARHDPQVRSGVQVLARGCSTMGEGGHSSFTGIQRCQVYDPLLTSRGTARRNSVGGGAHKRRAKRPLLTPPRGHRLRDTRASDQLTPFAACYVSPARPGCPPDRRYSTDDVSALILFSFVFTATEFFRSLFFSAL